MSGLDAAQYGNQVGGGQFGFDLDDRTHRIRAVETTDMVQRGDALDLIAGNAVDGHDGLPEKPFRIMRSGIKRDNRLARNGLRLDGLI